MDKLRLWENNFFQNSTDIIINFSGNKYELNKQILSVSSTLRNLFWGGYEESFKDEINLDIEEISIDSWELLLNYIYSKYIDFYNNAFRLKITNQRLPEISTLTTYDIIKLYATCAYFDISGYIEDLELNIINRIRPLLQINIFSNDNIDIDFDYISSLIENMPSDLLILKILDNLRIDEFFRIMSYCKDINNYFCNNIVFEKLQQSYKIPDNLTNLYELNLYLQTRKIELSDSLSDLYSFSDTISQDMLYNYFILKYYDLDIDQIRDIIINYRNNFVKYDTRKISKFTAHNIIIRDDAKKLSRR